VALRTTLVHATDDDDDDDDDDDVYITQELVRARRRLQQRSLPGVETSEELQGEQNLTLVMIIIIIIFVVCQSPAFANQLLYYLIGDQQYACGQVTHFLTVI